MVAWNFCKSCHRPVDEYESCCGWCGDGETAKELREYVKNMGKSVYKKEKTNYPEVKESDPDKGLS